MQNGKHFKETENKLVFKADYAVGYELVHSLCFASQIHMLQNVLDSDFEIPTKNM